jgi:hypothetical protein
VAFFTRVNGFTSSVMDLPGKNYILLQKVHAAAGFHCTLFCASL